MDENTWKFAQILMWLFGTQTLVLIGIFGGFWAHFNRRFDQIDDHFDKLDQRFEKLENRVTQIEHDMVEVKTILRFKECCMIQDEKQLKKVE